MKFSNASCCTHNFPHWSHFMCTLNDERWALGPFLCGCNVITYAHCFTTDHTNVGNAEFHYRKIEILCQLKFVQFTSFFLSFINCCRCYLLGSQSHGPNFDSYTYSHWSTVALKMHSFALKQVKLKWNIESWSLN